MTHSEHSRTLSGIVNQVTYGINEKDLLLPEVAVRRAREIVDRRLFSQAPDEYYEPIREALRAGEPEVGGDEDPLRGFLQGLITELDRLRPWLGPDFVLLPGVESGNDLWSAPVIGYVAGTFRAVATHLRGFSTAQRQADGGALVVIRLRSGEVMGIRATGSTDQRVALVSADAAASILAFERTTGLTVIA